MPEIGDPSDKRWWHSIIHDVKEHSSRLLGPGTDSGNVGYLTIRGTESLNTVGQSQLSIA
jgi:hypothetical protein